MRIVFATVIMLGLAASTQAAPVDDVARLTWLSGSWAQEKGGVLVRETWLSPKDGVMAGASQTNTKGKPAFVEHMKITAEPAGATFTAILPGQPPTPFVLLPGKADEAVFENTAHDFPQRVIYRRCGADLCARIEGLVKGKLQFEEWRYKRVAG